MSYNQIDPLANLVSPQPPPPPSTNNHTVNLDALLGVEQESIAKTSSSPVSSNSIETSKQSIIAINKDGLKIEMFCEKSPNDPLVTLIEMQASNCTPFVMTDFLFQAAVPKVS